jgi:hypothetical protein
MHTGVGDTAQPRASTPVPPGWQISAPLQKTPSSQSALLAHAREPSPPWGASADGASSGGPASVPPPPPQPATTHNTETIGNARMSPSIEKVESTED